MCDGVQTRSHPVEEVHSAHSSHFPRVVHETHVPIRCSVELSDVSHTEPVLKLTPDVCAESVPHSQSHRVLPVCRSLRKHRYVERRDGKLKLYLGHMSILRRQTAVIGVILYLFCHFSVSVN